MYIVVYKNHISTSTQIRARAWFQSQFLAWRRWNNTITRCIDDITLSITRPNPLRTTDREWQATKTYLTSEGTFPAKTAKTDKRLSTPWFCITKNLTICLHHVVVAWTSIAMAHYMFEHIVLYAAFRHSHVSCVRFLVYLTTVLL